MRVENQEQPFHPIYNYAFITDRDEGLIAIDVNTLADGEPRNNFLERALTWNEDGILDGARHLTIAGHCFYVAADAGIVVLDMDEPLAPEVAAVVPLDGRARDRAAVPLPVRRSTATGLKVVDVTHPERPRSSQGAAVPLADAHRVYVARTYAYVAARPRGPRRSSTSSSPERPSLYMTFTADGQLNDARDVVVGTTNASLFAYVADGENGLKVIQLTSPDEPAELLRLQPGAEAAS